MNSHGDPDQNGKQASASEAQTLFARPFDVLQDRPDGEAPASALVFSSPHSGSVYPESFLAASRLDPLTIRRSEDAFVDELFAGAIRTGAPLLRAHFPRAFLDVNREPYELDPRMFEGRLPAGSNTRSVRVAGGLGTIARIVGEAQEIYHSRIPVAEALNRIETLYRPYHRALRDLLDLAWRHHGVAVLIECHSMPSVAWLSAANRMDEAHRADFILGDRYGTSCHPGISAWIETELESMGYSVRRNKPYAGGYITETYGAPAMGVHAIQIEVNRSLYMDEARLEKHGGFDAIARGMERLALRLNDFVAMQYIRTRGAEAAE